MNLRRPQDILAGCCWLPRMADKVRTHHAAGLPLLYRLSLGSPVGVDGYFLRHFHLSFRAFQSAVLETGTDSSLAEWFLSQPGVTIHSITAWNAFGPKMGTPGYPGSLMRRLFAPYIYPESPAQPVDSIFQLIERDEAP